MLTFVPADLSIALICIHTPYLLPPLMHLSSPSNAFSAASHSSLPLDPMLSQFLKGFTSVVILSPLHQFLLVRALILAHTVKPNQTFHMFPLN